MKFKVLAKSSSDEGMLPMKQSPELEAKKSEKQRNEEICNFIKNAFVVNGDVAFVELSEPIKFTTGFFCRDSERGNFIVSIKKD